MWLNPQFSTLKPRALRCAARSLPRCWNLFRPSSSDPGSCLHYLDLPTGSLTYPRLTNWCRDLYRPLLLLSYCHCWPGVRGNRSFYLCPPPPPLLNLTYLLNRESYSTPLSSCRREGFGIWYFDDSFSCEACKEPPRRLATTYSRYRHHRVNTIYRLVRQSCRPFLSMRSYQSMLIEMDV